MGMIGENIISISIMIVHITVNFLVALFFISAKGVAEKKYTTFHKQLKTLQIRSVVHPQTLNKESSMRLLYAADI